jgi:hypothetical protein
MCPIPNGFRDRGISLYSSKIVEAPTLPLDSRLTDGGEVISPTRRPPFTPRKIPGTHFSQRLSRSQGHSAAGRIQKIEKFTEILYTVSSTDIECSSDKVGTVYLV